MQTVASFRDSGHDQPIWLTTKVTSLEHATALAEKAVDESVEKAKAGGLVWVNVQSRIRVSGARPRLGRR